MSDEERVLKSLLNEQLNILNKSISHLNYSLNQVVQIEIKENMNSAELVLFDSFSARFMRCYEILINQILKTIIALNQENPITHIDRIRLAEKLNLITSESDINTIRILRNTIAHDYLEHEWLKIYAQLISTTPTLINCADLTLKYIKSNLLLHTE